MLSIRRCQYVASPDVVNYDAVQFPYSDCFHQTFLILLESSIVTVSLHLKQRNHEKWWENDRIQEKLDNVNAASSFACLRRLVVV